MSKTKICTIFAVSFMMAITIICGLLAALYNEKEENINTNMIEVVVVVAKPIKENTEHLETRVLAQNSMAVTQEINSNFDILTPCGYTQNQLEQTMMGEYHKGMLPYVETIVNAEEKYGVNALYLLCKLGLESGWGKYMAAENNIGGWTNNKGGYKEFESVEDCIMHIAENLSTVYKEDVGTKLVDVCEKYCPEDGYLELLMQIMIECEERIK